MIKRSPPSRRTSFERRRNSGGGLHDAYHIESVKQADRIRNPPSSQNMDKRKRRLRSRSVVSLKVIAVESKSYVLYLSWKMRMGITLSEDPVGPELLIHVISNQKRTTHAPA